MWEYFNVFYGLNTEELHERKLNRRNIPHVLGVKPSALYHLRDRKVAEEQGAIGAFWVWPHDNPGLGQIVGLL